jgi:hypothetical protein
LLTTSKQAIQLRLAQLDALLHKYETIWKDEPFQHLSLRWQDSYSKLYFSLINLSDDQLHHLSQTPSALIRLIDEQLELGGQLIELSSCPSLSKTKQINNKLPSSYINGIPGRKLNQIIAFSEHLSGSDKTNTSKERYNQVSLYTKSFTDWCCGKGHLARVMHYQHKAPVIGLEYSPKLCVKGNNLSKKLAVDVTIIEQDVLQPLNTPELFQNHQTALHACGDLHRQMIIKSASNKAPTISFSPCCYHLTDDYEYQMISNFQSALSINKEQLKLAVQETVTAPQRDQKQRRILKLWRVAFDLIQREATGHDQYQHCPSLPLSAVNLGFPSLVEKFSEHLQIKLSTDIPLDDYLHRAEKRLNQIERLELARQGFRRALELWLVYDRSLFLAEQGYHVTIGTFCSRDITPRNIMIQAVHQRELKERPKQELEHEQKREQQA